MTRARSAFCDYGYRGYETRVSLVRLQTEYEPIKINGPRNAYQLLRPIQDLDRESLYSLMLDAQNTLVGCEEISRGGLNTVRTRPAEIYKGVLLSNACGFILAHNHPSGDPNPSREDIDFTDAISQAGDLLGVELYDHIIVGEGDYASLRERGLMVQYMEEDRRVQERPVRYGESLKSLEDSIFRHRGEAT